MTKKDPAKAFTAERKAQQASRIRLLSDTRAEIARLLQEAQDRITQLLADQPSSADQWILPQLQAQVRQTMGEFSDQAAGTLGTRAGEAWVAGQALVDAPLAAAGVAMVAPVLDTRQLMAMRAFLTDRIKDVGAKAVNQINTQLGLTILGAQTPSEAVSGVKAILGEQSRARALTITRTELSRVYSTAAHERLLQQAENVEGLRKQWRASGKLHPRHNHHIADGQVQDVDKPFKLGTVTMMYPHDPKAPASETINCGCTMLPWMESWDTAMAHPKRKYDDPGPSVNELLGAETGA